MLDFYFKWN